MIFTLQATENEETDVMKKPEVTAIV